MDILTVLSEKHKPIAVIGAVCSQAPDCGSIAAKSLALFSGRVALSSNFLN